MSFLALIALCVLSRYTQAQSVVPKWPPQYQMNLSTLVMPCNESGYFNDAALQKLAKFGIVSIDWSNAKQQWANAQPMDCEERLLTQVKAIKAINPSTKTWVYRNLVKALPYVKLHCKPNLSHNISCISWFTDVRKKLIDPNY
eukprot:237516_1